MSVGLSAGSKKLATFGRFDLVTHWLGVTSGFGQAFQAPGKTLAANKNTPNDFELYIPYSELPVSAGTKVQVVFRAILIDGEELKWLYSSAPVNFSVLKN